MKHRKVRVFLVFLAFSFTAWFISRLSQSYTHTVKVKLEYAHLPREMVLIEAPPDAIGVRLRASGFQLLRYQLSPKTIAIDLREARQGSRGFYISPGAYRGQIEAQLGGSANLLQAPQDTLFVDFQKVVSKTLPVRVVATLDFAQNYMLDGELVISPETVEVLGPPAEIDSLRELRTVPLVLEQIREDFSQTLTLAKRDAFPNTRFSADRISVSGEVFRFSEAVVEVPVEVVNAPEALQVQTFPKIVGVLCRGRITALKDLDPADFRLVADYASAGAESGRLRLSLEKQPEGVYVAQPLETSVEFIIKRE
jgi:hypothetical protein